MTNKLPTNIVETAKSGRSICGSCKKAIAKGWKRVGVRRWAPFRQKGSGYLSVRWHHPECIPVSGSFTAQISKEDNNERESLDRCLDIDQFSQAARMAVREQIFDFVERMLCEATLPLSCPYTGDLLEKIDEDDRRTLRTDAHVHHFGPTDFKSIVQGFLRSAGIRLDLVSYVSGQFANADLEGEFRKYHKKHSRLLLISARANLSIVKRHPALGPCDYCKSVRNLTWVFGQGICHKCREKSSVRYHFPSQRLANKIFSLQPSDLVDLECQRMTNPKNSGFSPMKLYRREDLESVATNKYGSVEAARACVRKRAAQRQRQRKLDYTLAKSFNMRLRSNKQHTFADDMIADGLDDFATTAQLKYLRALKLEIPIGISKKHASNLIDEKLEASKKIALSHRKIPGSASVVVTTSLTGSNKNDENQASKSGERTAKVHLERMTIKARARKGARKVYATPFLEFVAKYSKTETSSQVLSSDDPKEHPRALAMAWRSLSELEAQEFQTSSVKDIKSRHKSGKETFINSQSPKSSGAENTDEVDGAHNVLSA